MNAEERDILRALYDGQRVAEAERKSDRALLEAIMAKLDGLMADVGAMKEEIGELNARDRYFIHKLGEHEAEISVVKHRLQAK